MGDGFAIEEPAHQRDGLVEPVQALTGGLAEVDAERLVLALEPGAADTENRPAVRDVIERCRQLRGQPWVPECVCADHEPQSSAGRDRGEAREERPALEDRLLPRALDREEVIPGPDRVPTSRLGRERRFADLRPRRPLGPQLQPEPDLRHSPLIP